jgi:malonate transporter MadL subunit
MTIYGTALLAICVLAGTFAGRLLGSLLGLQADVGGIGLAMILLIFVTDRLRKVGRLLPESTAGITFWNSLYIPIVVALAASQDVTTALHGGPMALLAGSLVVMISFALVPLINRIGGGHDTPD